VQEPSRHEPCEPVKITVEAGTVLFEVGLDIGFFRPDDYDWDQQLSHNHADFEIHLVQLGRCVMLIEDQQHELPEGTYCVIPPGTYHSQLSNKHDQVRKICLRFHYRAAADRNSQARDPEAETFLQVLDGMTFYKQTDSSGTLQSLMTAIKRELLEKLVGYRAKTISLLAQLLIDLIRTAPHAPAEEYRPVVPLNPDDNRTGVIDAYFAAHYNEAVKEEQLARRLNVSTRQLHRILNELYRTSFRRKLLETRMKIAMELLTNTDRPVHDIAAAVGYQSPGNFHAAFRQNVGLTPAAYRNQQNPKD